MTCPTPVPRMPFARPRHSQERGAQEDRGGHPHRGEQAQHGAQAPRSPDRLRARQAAALPPNAGDATAAFTLWTQLRENDFAAAERWLRKAADLGEPRAVQALGMLLWERQDLDGAEATLRSAAADPEGAHTLGRLLWRGRHDLLGRGRATRPRGPGGRSRRPARPRLRPARARRPPRRALLARQGSGARRRSAPGARGARAVTPGYRPGCSSGRDQAATSFSAPARITVTPRYTTSRKPSTAPSGPYTAARSPDRAR